MADLTLIIISFQCLSLLAIPVTSAKILFAPLYASLIVWAAVCKQSLRSRLAFTLPRAKSSAAPQSNLIDVCHEWLAANLAVSLNPHCVRPSFRQLWLMSCVFRSALIGAKTTRTAGPRFKLFTTPFTYTLLEIARTRVNSCRHGFLQFTPLQISKVGTPSGERCLSAVHEAALALGYYSRLYHGKDVL